MIFKKKYFLYFLLIGFKVFISCTEESNPVFSNPVIETDTDEKDTIAAMTHEFISEQFEASCIYQIPVSPADSSVFRQWCLGDTVNGFGIAFREDHLWKSSGGATIFRDRIIIGLSTFNCNDLEFGVMERLYFDFLINSESCISLNAHSTSDLTSIQGNASFRYLDYDVTLDRFNSKKDETNLLEITKLDTINMEVSGRFMLTLERTDEPDFFSIGSDTFSFVNGEFHCKIIE